MKYRHSRRCFTHRVRGARRVRTPARRRGGAILPSRTPGRPLETPARRGVWLGRHICYTTTQVSYGGLSGDGNLAWSTGAKARLMAAPSTGRDCESTASDPLRSGRITPEVPEKLPQG